MQSITSADDLRAAIVTLKRRRREQEQELNNRYVQIVERLKPVNVIRTIVRDVAEAPGVRHRMVNAGVGLVVGYVFRKLLFGPQIGPLKKILGAALQVGIAGLIGKNGDAIQAGGYQLVRRLLVNLGHNGESR